MSRVICRSTQTLRVFRWLSTCTQVSAVTIQLRPRHEEGIRKLLYTNKLELHTSRSLLKVIPYKLSDIGEGIFEVTIKEWYIQPGDNVAQFQEICEVQSDKAAVTITCRYDGVVQKLYHKQDELCRVGTPLIDIEVADDVVGAEVVGTEPSEKEEERVEESREVSTGRDADGDKKVLATPVVRKMAKDLGINLSEVTGTGRDGRILKEDVHNFSKSRKTTDTFPPPVFAISGEDKVVKLTQIQQVMIQTMTASGRVPQFGYCEEIKAGKLREFKRDLQEQYGREGLVFTYMPIFLKATSIALTHYPILNAVYNETEDAMVYKAYHNIGVAMDTPDGLLVPNIKNVERKSIMDIAVELNEMHKLGTRGKIPPQQLVGGTFSISNIGAIGGTYARPMVLLPEVCIVAIGRIHQPGGVGDEVINTSYSADHRVIDGATVSRFSNLWKVLIERPALLATELK